MANKRKERDTRSEPRCDVSFPTGCFMPNACHSRRVLPRVGSRECSSVVGAGRGVRRKGTRETIRVLWEYAPTLPPSLPFLSLFLRLKRFVLPSPIPPPLFCPKGSFEILHTDWQNVQDRCSGTTCGEEGGEGDCATCAGHWKDAWFFKLKSK